MANNYRHPVTIDKLDYRSVIKNKLTTEDAPWSSNTERAMSKVGLGMSPEARRAMVLTREETKGQTLPTGHRASKAESNLTKTNDVSSRTPEQRPQRGPSGARAKPQRTLQAASRSLSRSREASGAVGSSPFTRATKPQPTARSRSTLSNTGPACSTASEHNDSCSGADSRNKNRSSNKNNNGSSSSTAGKHHQASSLANNNNSRQGSSKTDKDMICYGSRRDLLDIGSDNDVLDYDDADDDSSQMTDDEENNNNKNTDKCKSFVLALDRALEENGVSRLRGDITDSVGITEPGTVRALDGGRLANAQEVVVNVCHDDERELVFHDDDDDSLDTAKNVSQIRINIWMEYNQGFDVDNVTDDLDLGIPIGGDDDDTKSSRYELPYRDISDNPSSVRNRDGKAKPINRNLRVPGRTDAKKLSPKRDSNNNSGAETWRAKTSSAGSTRGASSALTGSGVSNEGSKKSSSSSNRRESYLKRKVKASS